MTYKIYKFCFILLIAIFLLTPFFDVRAAGLISCNGLDCTVCDIFKSIVNIINFLVTYVMLPLAGLLFVASGIMMAMGGASEEMYKKGKKSLASTAIGVAIVLASWVIINSIITVFVNSGDVNSAAWYQVNCNK